MDAESYLFHARGEANSKTGRVLAYSIDPATGRLSEAWEASRKLPAADRRQIITFNDNGAPAAFRWRSLDAGRRSQLDDDPALLDYLRGDAELEGSKFRARQDQTGPNRLGDIAFSVPVYVGAPGFRYRDEFEAAPYYEFARTYAQRAPMLYVGANDGMLHAFHAHTGVEVFAFAPGTVFANLRKTAHDGPHQPFVDGSPSVGDVFVDGRWRTLLVGALGRGGQGVYALDITDPAKVADVASHAADIALWEFTDADDPDLGLTYSRPVIARLRNGAWAAIFGNGYGSQQPDARASATGNAVLFIVDIATGEVIRKLDTGVGAKEAPRGAKGQNGLSTPAAADLDGDRIVDVVYAGDLYGNLWRFNVASSNSGDWSVAFGGEPLYQARSLDGDAQAVSMRPEIARGPRGKGALVLFGAGPHLPQQPVSAASRASTFYGVADGDGKPVRAPLALRPRPVERELARSHSPFERIRLGSNEPAPQGPGWRMDLAAPSDPEYFIGETALLDGRVIFRTLADPISCNGEGTVWTMSLRSADGGAADSSFDFSAAETVAAGEASPRTTAVAGFASSTRAIVTYGSTAVVQAQADDGKCLEHLYEAAEKDRITHLVRDCPRGASGRQSWRQLR